MLLSNGVVRRPKPKHLNFSLAVFALCPECGHKETTWVDKNKHEFWHECNSGNVCSTVPSLAEMLK